jgi:hypothetical protein
VLVPLPFDILFELIDLKTEGNTLLAFHTGVGIGYFQMMLEFVTVLFQVNQPYLSAVF